MKIMLTAMIVAQLVAGCGGDEEVAGNGTGVLRTESGSESNQSPAETSDAKTTEIVEIDLDDNETRKKIIAEAIDGEKLQWRGKEELAYAPNQKTPFSGWTKRMHDNGRISGLYQYKDGKRDGLWTGWHRNGQKAAEGAYKDGKVVRD